MGASKSLDIVDSFALIPAEKAGKYYYIPNIEAANRQIHQWAKEEICFCGFIHSHITDKKELSEGDIKFAEQLFNSFHLPVLWFGLQILTKKCRETKFFSVQKSDTKVEISSVCWEMEGEDDEKAYLQIKSGTQISFSSGNARLEYSDGEVKSSNNVSGPYSLRSDGDNDDGEIEFCIEKQQLGKDGFCSVSNDAGGNELTIINDGWSVSIVSDKPIQISMDNTEQSVKIQSEEKGLLSAWLTQNTPSANSAWYGTAVDVNDAKELILTPTSEGVKVNSDNMQDARVTVNGDGTFASKAINTTKNEILVQEDADATIGDCIKIQGTYTIRASVGLHGTISPAGYVAVDAGGTQTFTFTPDEGYTVEHVKVNGKNKGEITDYTFKKVKKDQEIEVTFREKTEQDSEPKEKSGYGPILDWILSIIEWIKHWFQA